MEVIGTLVAGVTSFGVALSGIAVANVLVTMMIREINRKRQGGDLVSDLGFTFPKLLRIFGEYRRSFPSGRLHVYTLAAFAVGVAGLIATAACLGIIGS